MVDDEIFYTYVILDTRKAGEYNYGDYKFDYEPIYIGKGKGNRKDYHFFHSRLVKYGNKLKNNVINKILKETGEYPIVEIIKNNITEENSLKLEIGLIELIGRRDLKLGPLCNLTNGGEGQSGSLEQIGEKNGFYGKKHKRESFDKYRKPIKQLTLDGDLIRIFASLNDAAIETNSISSKISSVGKGNRITHNGFKWEFVNDVDKTSHISYDKVEFKYIEQIDIHTDDVLNIFNSISEAASSINMYKRKGGLTSCLRGSRNTFGGFKWKSGSLEQIGEKNGFYGKKNKGESLKEDKQCKVLAKYTNKIDFKYIEQIDILTNEIIATHKSITFISKELSIPKSNLINCLKGRRNSCGGFKWKYKLNFTIK